MPVDMSILEFNQAETVMNNSTNPRREKISTM
jgi:hypothetical protein